MPKLHQMEGMQHVSRSGEKGGTSASADGGKLNPLCESEGMAGI